MTGGRLTASNRVARSDGQLRRRFARSCLAIGNFPASMSIVGRLHAFGSADACDPAITGIKQSHRRDCGTRDIVTDHCVYRVARKPAVGTHHRHVPLEGEFQVYRPTAWHHDDSSYRIADRGAEILLLALGVLIGVAEHHRIASGAGDVLDGSNHHCVEPVSYTHLRAHETDSYLVCRLLHEKK